MVELHFLVFQILLQQKEVTSYIFSKLHSTLLKLFETLINELSLTSDSS